MPHSFFNLYMVGICFIRHGRGPSITLPGRRYHLGVCSLQQHPSRISWLNMCICITSTSRSTNPLLSVRTSLFCTVICSCLDSNRFCSCCVLHWIHPFIYLFFFGPLPPDAESLIMPIFRTLFPLVNILFYLSALYSLCNNSNYSVNFTSFFCCTFCWKQRLSDGCLLCYVVSVRLSPCWLELVDSLRSSLQWLSSLNGTFSPL